MQKITSLIRTILDDRSAPAHLSHLTFTRGEMFGWDHTACAISYNPQGPHAADYLLHEYGHAVLNHSSYTRDIELIAMERAAWDTALEQSARFGMTIDEETIENALDSYRDWLHARSRCTSCQSTGIQIASTTYQCLACHATWHVNAARTCALRRYPTKKRS